MADKIMERKDKERVNAMRQAKTFHKAMVTETLGVPVVKTNNQWPHKKELSYGPMDL